MTVLRYLAVLSLLVAHSVLARADSVTELSDSFWQWRAQEQPFSEDDIPRIERPAGLVVDWSPQTMQQRLQQLEAFEQRWKALAPPAATPDPRPGGLPAAGLRGGPRALGAIHRAELEA